MVTRTVRRPWVGEYRPHINFGGRARYCPFSFTVLPDLGCPGVFVVPGADADEQVIRWLPSLAAGVQRYWEERRDAGILLRGIRVEIHAVKTHPVDTYDTGVQSLGHSFMYEVERVTEEVIEAGSHRKEITNRYRPGHSPNDS
jgi:hypothetical protein